MTRIKQLIVFLLSITLLICLPGTRAEEITTLRILVRTDDLLQYEQGILALNDLLLRAGLNIQLEWTAHEPADYAGFLNGILASGDTENSFDLVYIQGTDVNPARLGSLGYLTDLTDFLHASQHAGTVYDANPILTAQFQNCPYLLWPSQVNKVLQFRTDALEACPSYAAFLENPDRTAYARLFTELSQQGYEGALTTMSIEYLFDTGLDGGFGISHTWLMREDGSLVYCRVSEPFLKELQWWRELYLSGALHTDFATDNWESMENALYTGRVPGIAMKGGAYTVHYETNVVQNYGGSAALTILPPMRSPDGIQQYRITARRSDRGWCIPAASQHAQQAFDFLDFMLSEEGRRFDLFGLEGEDYTLTADGRYNLLVNSANTRIYRIFDADVFAGVDVQAITTGTPYWPKSSFDSADMTAAYGVPDNDFDIPEEFVTAWTACEELWKMFATQYILGAKTDADWQNYVDAWNDYGGTLVTDYAATVLGERPLPPGKPEP